MIVYNLSAQLYRLFWSLYICIGENKCCSYSPIACHNGLKIILKEQSYFNVPVCLVFTNFYEMLVKYSQ